MKAVIKRIGLQTGTDRTVFITWEWDHEKNPTDHYKVKWYYNTGDGIWFNDGGEQTVTGKQSIYNAKANATSVKVTVKPIAKTRKVNNKDVAYFTADWATSVKYYFKNNPPVVPTGLTATIDKYKLTASLDNLDVNATHIEFHIVKADKSTFNKGTAKIKTNAASYSCDVTAGYEYKVRCRSFKDDEYSEWSDYVDVTGGTPPAASTGIVSLKALSSTSVSINWNNVSTAETYEVQWTTKKKYFDSSNQVDSLPVDAKAAGHAEVTGLESGQEYFFRVRAVNDHGSSAWTEIASIIIGKAPSVPTTWSSKTTLKVGEPLTLYWVHNTEDGSTQTEAQVEITINGDTEIIHHITKTGEEETERTYSHDIDTSQYPEGTKLQWRVKTKGITNDYSEWSIQRTVDIYAPPTLTVRAIDGAGEELGTVKSFPFYISLEAGADSYQKPIGYHVSVVSTWTYETTDQIGNIKIVNVGDEVYSKYFDATKDFFGRPIAQELITMTPGNIDLENNNVYRINAVVSMDSGLTASHQDSILVSWDDETYYPNAEIGIDEETVSAYIGPYAVDKNGNLANDVLLSVYRREFDGSFVEIATGLQNSKRTFVTDPHPSLDYARYRVVAISELTGAVSYYDVPGHPVSEKAVIIQWAENWSDFEVTNEDKLEQPPWSGSMLKLPYNIDVSESNDPDVELVEYMGRKHPVTYYGTHVGHKAVWNVEIPKSDKETLYALRRLESWMGDVYVREPSGSGYWANITVSISQKHRVLSVPVTINVTRVEGGV